jgi:hypothetical protein
VQAEAWPCGLSTVAHQGKNPFPADARHHAIKSVLTAAATAGAFEADAAKRPAIHFTICP